MYAIRSNALRHQELLENHFKGGSSEFPGALRARVNGASGHPNVTADAVCGFVRLRSGFFLLSASFKNILSLFSCPVGAQSDLKVFHIASSILKAISHALTRPISRRTKPSNSVFYGRQPNLPNKALTLSSSQQTSTKRKEKMEESSKANNLTKRKAFAHFSYT